MVLSSGFISSEKTYGRKITIAVVATDSYRRMTLRDNGSIPPFTNSATIAKHVCIRTCPVLVLLLVVLLPYYLNSCYFNLAKRGVQNRIFNVELASPTYASCVIVTKFANRFVVNRGEQSATSAIA